jgi:hypothetical protein
MAQKPTKIEGWRPTAGEILFAVVMALIPWTFPTIGVTTRCFLWLSAWLIFLHLMFTLVPILAGLPTFVRLAIAVGLTAFGCALAYRPIVDIWREEMAGAVTGRLKPDRGDRNDPVKLQIGPNAKTLFTWTGPNSVSQLGSLGNSIEFDRNKNGELTANTVIRDREGHMLVEIVDNEWRVSSAAWEKNYTNDALEVKDADGKIVFQLRLFADRAEIQAEWWNKDGKGSRLVQLKDKPESPDSDKKGFVIVMMDTTFHPDDPVIQPIFRYPSKHYFGMFKPQPWW